MPADIDTIETVFFSALQTLTKEVAGSNAPFTTANRWFGKVRSISELPWESFGRAPVVILNLEEDKPQRTQDTLSQGVITLTCTLTMNVYVAVQDTRGANKVVKNSGNNLGLLKLACRVRALHGIQVPDPPSTLSFTVTGTANATVTFGSSLLRFQSSVSYQPTTPQVVLNGSGVGTINAQCVTVGSIGNLPNGAILTWTATPTNLNSTAVVASTVTAGINGLTDEQQVVYEGTTFDAAPGIQVAKLRFTAKATMGKYDPTADLTGLPLLRIDSDYNLGDRDSEAFPNPILQSQSDTS